MEIECPHCKIAFEGSDCVLKDRKQVYKWYEFTGKSSHCPHCGKRYQADLSATGFICFVLLLIVIATIAHFGNELMAIPILFVAYYFGKRHWKKIMKITAVHAT